MPSASMSGVTQKLQQAFSDGLTLLPQVEPHLKSAVQQTLSHPGSLVRARLVYQISRAYELDEGVALPLAMGVEYFHTASLLFDDLPCMDDAQERRGVPCPHTVYGEAAAILAALGLINRAYALLWEAMAGAPEPLRRQASAFVESRLGLAGVLNGQSWDLHCGHTRRAPGRVLAVAMGKTVPLIQLALVLPALLAGAPSQEVRLWQRLAVWWGLSYQMLDDLKDVWSEPEATGKTGHRDGLLNRPNLALAEGAVRTLHRVLRLVTLGDQALQRFSQKDGRWDFLQELRDRFTQELRTFPAAEPHLCST